MRPIKYTHANIKLTHSSSRLATLVYLEIMSEYCEMAWIIINFVMARMHSYQSSESMLKNHGAMDIRIKTSKHVCERLYVMISYLVL